VFCQGKGGACLPSKLLTVINELIQKDLWWTKSTAM